MRTALPLSIYRFLLCRSHGIGDSGQQATVSIVRSQCVPCRFADEEAQAIQSPQKTAVEQGCRFHAMPGHDST
jgi:hypothetical protein